MFYSLLQFVLVPIHIPTEDDDDDDVLTRAALDWMKIYCHRVLLLLGTRQMTMNCRGIARDVTDEQQNWVKGRPRHHLSRLQMNSIIRGTRAESLLWAT